MDGDAYCSASITANNTSQRRKSVEKCEGFSCLSPKFLLSRWFNGQKSKFRSNVVERRKGKQEGPVKFDEKRKKKIVMASMNGESSTTSAPEESGQHKEVSFNFGLGFGLIYLLVKSKNELNKVQNLHKEMEMLLQSLKHKLQNHEQDALSIPSKQNKVISPPNTDSHGVLHSKGNVSCEEFPTSCYLEDQDITQCYISRQQSKKKMDLLEAELEAELEHLQLKLDTEIMFYRKQQYTEIIVEDTAPEGSLDTSFGEVIDPPQVSHKEEYGVSPSELERRLHELLEARQEERIKELELALDCATQKIHEKERELSWWKDTAKLVFQHVPVTSHL